jgi:hypothetical protein
VSDLDQHLDRPYARQPATRAAAVRVLERLGAADLIPMLGLDDADEAAAAAGVGPRRAAGSASARAGRAAAAQPIGGA